MNVCLRIAAIAVSVAGLSSCASKIEKSSYVEPRPAGSFVTDDAYVAYVERVARRRGIGVTWVNVPSKRVVKDENQQ